MKKDRFIAILTTLMFSATAFTGCIPTRTSSASELTPSGSLASTSDVASFSDSSEAASSESDVVYNVETIEVPNLPVSEESFLEYFDSSWFPRFFCYPAKNAEELANFSPDDAFLFAVYQTLLLEAERGVTFELTEEGHYLVPGEMIRRTAWELLGLELTADELFAMSGGKECSRFEPESLMRLEGTDRYYSYLAFGLREGMKDTIIENTLRFTKQETSIQTTWWTEDEDPNIPLRRFTYYFRIVEGNRIPYQLVRIIEN